MDHNGPYVSTMDLVIGNRLGANQCSSVRRIVHVFLGVCVCVGGGGVFVRCQRG